MSQLVQTATDAVESTDSFISKIGSLKLAQFSIVFFTGTYYLSYRR